MTSLVRTAGGYANLHVWRGGIAYERQKGNVYRREWNNLRFTVLPQPDGEREVRYHDVRRLLPYESSSFDAVYLLHIVEHLTPGEVRRLLADVKRVLKPGGMLRVSTPDLAEICRAYVAAVRDHDERPGDETFVRYEWSVIELLDQIARVHEGGRMAEYVARGRYDSAYARQRYGDVFDEFHVPPASPAPSSASRRWLRPLTSFPVRVRRAVEWRLAVGDAARHDPRRNGEANKWLYDRYSLSRLLEGSGFGCVRAKCYRTSDIPEWERFDLDRSSLGDYPFEPSLYVEARLPAQAAFVYANHDGA